MLRVAFALFCCWIVPAWPQAQPMTEAAAQLAARISPLPQHRTTVSLEFQNLTAMAPAEWSNFRGALEEELHKSGLEVATTAQPESRLRITMSENARGLLFVAELSTGENWQVAMLPWNVPPRAGSKPKVKITLQAVWEQQEPVLDFLLLDSGSALLVLSPSKVASYRLTDGKWMLAGVAAVALARPSPRDPRGRMETGGVGFRVYVPGTTCTGTLPAEIKLVCAPGNDKWPVGPSDAQLTVRWIADRNLLESDGVRDTFYAAANGVFAVNGRIQDRASESVTGADGWGSDLAGIENPCGSSPTVLASAGGDASGRDELTAYEIANGVAAATTDPMALPGPVTALWPAETRGRVSLVFRNSKTGNYEATLVGLSCAE